MQAQKQLPEEFKSEKYAKAQGWNIPKEKKLGGQMETPKAFQPTA